MGDICTLCLLTIVQTPWSALALLLMVSFPLYEHHLLMAVFSRIKHQVTMLKSPLTSFRTWQWVHCTKPPPESIDLRPIEYICSFGETGFSQTIKHQTWTIKLSRLILWFIILFKYFSNVIYNVWDCKKSLLHVQ